MPLYSYRCPQCHYRFTRLLKLAEYQTPQTCQCGHTAEKVIEAPAVHADYAGYNCPITNKWIEGRRAHEENLKRHGCRVLESGETQSIVSARAQEDAALETAIEHSADEFIANLPAVKREKLVGELEGGMTATVERQ